MAAILSRGRWVNRCVLPTDYVSYRLHKSAFSAVSMDDQLFASRTTCRCPKVSMDIFIYHIMIDWLIDSFNIFIFVIADYVDT